MKIFQSARSGRKSFMIILLALFHGLQVSAQVDTCHIELDFRGELPEMVYVGQVNGSRVIPLDTVPLIMGRAKFNLPDPVRGLYRILLNDSVSFDLLSGPEPAIVASLDAANPLISIDFQVSMENQVYYAYLKKRIEYDIENRRLVSLGNQAMARSGGKMNAEVDSLRRVYIALLASQKYYNEVLQLTHPGWLSAALVRSHQVPDYQAYADTAKEAVSQKEFYRQHFFDNINFNDSGLINTEVYYIAINDYLASFAKPASTQAYIDASRQILGIARPYPAFYDYSLKLLISNFEYTIWEKVFAALVEEYYLSYERREPALAEVYRKRVAAIYALEPGNPCPQLMQPGPDGRMINLNQIPGQIRVLVFWSAECEHCEEIMPDLKRLHSMYKKRGLEVLAIGMDYERGLWLQGIAKNQTQDWYHISDLKGLGGKVAADFNIWMTPVIYVVDADNKILLRPYSVAALERFLETATILNAP
jgi:peroxiredoxin